MKRKIQNLAAIAATVLSTTAVKADDFGTYEGLNPQLVEIAPGFNQYTDGSTTQFAPTTLVGLGDTAYDQGTNVEFQQIDALVKSGDNLTFGNYNITQNSTSMFAGAPVFDARFNDGMSSCDNGDGTKSYFAFDKETGDIFTASYDGQTWKSGVASSGITSTNYNTIIDIVATCDEETGLSFTGIADNGEQIAQSTESVTPTLTSLEETIPENISFASNGTNVTYTFTTPGEGQLYAVERSLDLNTWTPVQSIEGNGTQYTFTEPVIGDKVFYRASRE